MVGRRNNHAQCREQVYEFVVALVHDPNQLTNQQTKAIHIQKNDKRTTQTNSHVARHTLPLPLPGAYPWRNPVATPSRVKWGPRG